MTVALRPLTADDCETLTGWIGSEDGLYQWSGIRDFSWPLDAGQLRRDQALADPHRMLFAAVDGATGALVGHVKLDVQPHHRIGFIGRVLVDPDRRGRGCGVAMMRALADHAFDELSLHRLQLTVYSFNSGAIACYRRVGFVTEGVHPGAARGSDGWWTGLTMGLLASDRAAAAGIRAAQLADSEPVARLLTELGYPHDDAAAGQRLLAWASEPSATVLVAEVDAEVAGVVAVSRRPHFAGPGSLGRIVALSVDERHRGRGLGRTLVQAAEEWAGAHGCVDMEVTSNRRRDAAHPFYRALGYEDRCASSALYVRSLG